MSARRDTEICLNFAADPATRHTMRWVVIPAMKRRLSHLEQCRFDCERRDDWAKEWVAAGMVEEEESLRAAINIAETRLATLKATA